MSTDSVGSHDVSGGGGEVSGGGDVSGDVSAVSDDADLRARVRRTDPTAPGAVVNASSLEAVMSEIRVTPDVPGADGFAPVRRPGSRRRLALVSVAAAVAVVGAGWGVGALVSPNAPTVATPAMTLSAASDVDPSMAMCLRISPEVLVGVPLAFDGVVTSVKDGVAVLSVSKWFRGGDPASSTVAITIPDTDLVALIGAPTFVEGGRYLISSDGETIGLCGASDAYSPELAAIYAEAFTP